MQSYCSNILYFIEHIILHCILLLTSENFLINLLVSKNIYFLLILLSFWKKNRGIAYITFRYFTYQIAVISHKNKNFGFKQLKKKLIFKIYSIFNTN